MKNIKIKAELDRVAKEICPDLMLEFMPDMQQMHTFCAYIRIATPILIDRIEAIRNLSNESAIKNLLKMRIKDALLKSRDYINAIYKK